MTIFIAKILGSELAIYHEEGILIYGSLKEAFDQRQPIQISFEGVKRCSTQFLNAAVGKLYLLEDPGLVDSLLSYDFADYSLMNDKIAEVRDNAINSKEYDALVHNA
ncbi:MAG: STAS-like domain-containing protein [Bacteroidia bacterium]|nr:STAS-like domain-containing protein [Bacteroidia bacterium]